MLQQPALRSAAMRHGFWLQGSLEQFQERLQKILEDSAASMRQDSPCQSPQVRREWWRQRLKLDLRMAGLIKDLEEALLGPWR